MKELIGKYSLWLILLLALVLRLINLNQSYWLDEATQVLLSQDSVKNILTTHAVDFHPPLSYLITHFWLIGGTSEIWTRLLSVIFGVLTVWIFYKFIKEFFSKNLALMTAFLLAIAPFHIYYSQEVRMYALAALLAVLSSYFLLKLLSKDSLEFFVGYVISATLLIYTHYDGFLLLFTHLIYVLLFKRDQFKNYLLAGAAVCLFWLPWLPQFLLQLQGGMNIDAYLPGWRQVLSVPAIKALPLILFKFSMGRIDFDNQKIYLLIAGIVILIFGFLLVRGTRKLIRDKKYFFVLWFYFPLILSVLISFKVPINQPFRLLFILPAFYLLIAVGLYDLRRWFKPFLLAIMIISLSGLLMYYTNSKFWREDWRGASSFITGKLTSDSEVVFAWPSPLPPYQFYADSKQSIGVVDKFPATRQEIISKADVLKNKKEIYLFEYLQPLSDPQKQIQSVLSDMGFRQTDIYNFSGVGLVYHYERDI